MAYKDKDKQREAQRDWVRQKRKGSTSQGSTSQGSTLKQPSPLETVDSFASDGVVEFDNVEALLDDLHDTKPERTAQGNIRVSKPGDADYEPQCETTRAFIEDRPKRPESAKRGKDIKCFADLPPHVQQSIEQMSVVDGKTDNTVKANRTAIAINYQHQFPDRYYSTGVV